MNRCSATLYHPECRWAPNPTVATPPCEARLDLARRGTAPPTNERTPMRAVTLEAYHYYPAARGKVRLRSERQDIQFLRVGDSITVTLPPPAACVLYLTIPPEQFVKAIERLSERGKR